MSLNPELIPIKKDEAIIRKTVLTNIIKMFNARGYITSSLNKRLEDIKNKKDDDTYKILLDKKIAPSSNDKTYVDKIWKRKGTKFQNFNYIYNNYKNDIMNYERFFIVDDDIIMSTNDINNLFDISKKYDLWICQPSFVPESKSLIFNKVSVSI